MAQAAYIEIGNPHQAATNVGGWAGMALLLVGFYLPTSIASNYSKPLYGLSFLLCFGLYGVFLRRARSSATVVECLTASLIFPLLLCFTGTSPLHDAAYGALILYGALSVMLMLNLREVSLPRWWEPVWTVITILNFLIGVGILLGIQPVDQFVIRWYTVSKDYAELVPSMLLIRKPVLVFGTHSLAGFFFYLFFHLNWEAFLVWRKKKFFVFAGGYLLLTASLLSVTGVILAAVGLAEVLYYLWTRLRLKWLLVLVVPGLVTLGFAFPPSNASTQIVTDGAKFVTAMLTSTGGGFGGRLAPGGTLYYNIQYIRAHPFGPVGVSNSATLLFVDSGWVEYMLRGSVLLVAIIYGSLYLFLKRSLVSRKDRIWLFATILAFEVGFTSLTYQRSYFLLPFAVIFLNGLRRAQAEASPALHSCPA
jgi:hypothetical protein